MMTPTQARMMVESVLRQHASLGDDDLPWWYVRAVRERRCCSDPACTKPRHDIGGKICVRVIPMEITQRTADRLPEIERVLSTHLAGVIRTRIVPLDQHPGPASLHPAVWVWLD